MATPETSTPRRVVNEAVACAELGDELILLHTDTGIYFGLDTVGAETWNLLTQGVGEAAILQRLLAEYDADPTQLRVDLAAFLDTLETKGLVRTVTG